LRKAPTASPPPVEDPTYIPNRRPRSRKRAVLGQFGACRLSQNLPTASRPFFVAIPSQSPSIAVTAVRTFEIFYIASRAWICWCHNFSDLHWPSWVEGRLRSRRSKTIEIDLSHSSSERAASSRRRMSFQSSAPLTWR